MMVRVALLGDGTPGNPYRVALPNYHMVFHNPATGRAIVDIPAEDIEPAQPGENPVLTNVAQIGNVITGLDPTHRARWIQKLKARYKERAATYDLQEG